MSFKKEVCRKDIRKQKIKKNKMIDQAVKATLYNRRNQPQYQGELER